MSEPNKVSKRQRLIFLLLGGLVMLLFNVRYCNEVQTAERARFDGWVGSLSPSSLPENLEIEYRAPDGVKVVTPLDEEAKVRALRLMQVLREARVMGRLAAGSADRAVAIRATPDIEYTAGFSEQEALNSPQLQVFARLIAEFYTTP